MDIGWATTMTERDFLVGDLSFLRGMGKPPNHEDVCGKEVNDLFVEILGAAARRRNSQMHSKFLGRMERQLAESVAFDGRSAGSASDKERQTNSRKKEFSSSHKDCPAVSSCHGEEKESKRDTRSC